MSDFVAGVISGSLATLVGFGFTIAWDLWKIRRDDHRRSSQILRAVENELDENLEIAAENVKLLNAEMESLKDQKYLVLPMLLFKSGIWDLLKTNLPDELLGQGNLLGKLRDMSQAASHMNEGISSRQQFKDNMGALTGFTGILKARNLALLDEMSRFSTEATEVLKLHRVAFSEI